MKLYVMDTDIVGFDYFGCAMIVWRWYVSPFDAEIEPPIASYSSLPSVSRFVVLLGTQTGMSEILNEELGLLVKGLLHM